ncbi:MAG: enolase C-terminal domain-like protein, partial [Alphaproteobacteria bacterium]
MRITGVETRIVDAGMRNWVFVKVLTDQPGLHGWGEATLEWKTRAVAACVDDLTPLVAGQDPLAIEHLVQTMTKHGFWRLGAIGLSAVSGIEQALWDIKGKALGVPVWQLLGGKVRERVRLYTHLALGDSAAVYEAPDVGRLKAHADDIVAAGYSAFKVLLVPPTHYRAALPDVRQTGMLMDALRDHVGDGVDIMVDLHGRPPSVAVARAYVEALTPGRPLFVEEVLPPGHEIAMRDVAVASKVPLATGERLYARPDWLALFAHRSVDIVQPDLSHCGG